MNVQTKPQSKQASNSAVNRVPPVSDIDQTLCPAGEKTPWPTRRPRVEAILPLTRF